MIRVCTDQMEQKNQDFEIKKCFVQIEKLADDDSDDSSDLPPPKYLSPSKPKHKRSAGELLSELKSLQKIIKTDILSDYKMDEKMMSLRIEEFQEEEENDSRIENDLSDAEKDFFLLQSLQFFNSKDVTPAMCGYKDHIGISEFEDKMLSFKRVEIQNAMSFLLASTSNTITACKSFITYLLRTMNVQEDSAAIFTCFNALNALLLSEHPDLTEIYFNSAEIFMLFFNYGIDMNSFTSLQQWPDIQKEFTVPEFNTKSSSKIPSTWTLNLETILESFSKLASICTIPDKDLTHIVTFLVYFNFSNLLHLFPLIQENISICLNRITSEKWEEALIDIAREIVISLDFPNNKGKWHNILKIARSIPVYSSRGIQLQRLISFFVLKIMCSRNSVPEVDKTYVGFDIVVVQNLIKEFSNLSTETLGLAIKFLDIFLTHLNAPKEVYQELYNIIVRWEVALHHEASDAKVSLCLMMTKLQKFIGKNPVYKVSVLDNAFKRIKKEVEEVSIENVVATPFIATDIKMEVEEDVCPENFDSDINSGEQNISSKDKSDGLKSYVVSDVKPRHILNSNFNSSKSNTNSEVAGKEMEFVSKSYFIDSSVVVEENVNCNMNAGAVSTVDTNRDFSRKDTYDNGHPTVQELLSKETYESQCSKILTKIDNNIESESKFTNSEDVGIEIFDVRSIATSPFTDTIAEGNVQSLLFPNTYVLENINPHCEASLDDVLVYLDVAEECIDSNCNPILTFIKQEPDIFESEQILINEESSFLSPKLLKYIKQETDILEGEQPLINEKSPFLSPNSGKKLEFDENETYVEKQIPKIKDSLLNSIKYVDEVEHSYANADKFTENDPTCSKDLITAVKANMEARETENSKRKLQTSFCYEPANKKIKIIDNKVIDTEISNVLDSVVDMAVNPSLQNLPNKCQSISEVLTNNKECSSSVGNVFGDCDLLILDERETNEDVRVVQIRHSKMKLKRPLMGSSGYNKDKSLNRVRKNKGKKKRNNNKEDSRHKHKSQPSTLSVNDIPGHSGYEGAGSKHKPVQIKKLIPFVKMDDKIMKKRFYSHEQTQQTRYIGSVEIKQSFPLVKSYKKLKKPFYSCKQTKQKYAKLNYKKGKSIIASSGLNLIQSEYCEPNSNFIASSSQAQETYLSDDDIIELYTDPKRYADKECLVVFETIDQIVLSD